MNPDLEKRILAEWKKSPAIRAEFGDDFERFQAYRRAEAEGRLRRPGRQA